jgi:hypothetical protein
LFTTETQIHAFIHCLSNILMLQSYKYLGFIILFSLLASDLHGQVKFGFKAGLASYDIGTDSIRVVDNGIQERYTIRINEANYGFHAGMVLQININGFIIQPEVLWNTNRVDFKITEAGNVGRVISETYQFLDVPLLIGTKAGPLRLNIGPVGHVFLRNTSGLIDFDGYKEDFRSLTLGYQAGLGLDFWKLFIDIRYEGNLSNFGNHITFFGKPYQFTERPRRLLASIAFVF